MAHPKRLFTVPPCVTDLLFNLIGFLIIVVLCGKYDNTKQINEHLEQVLKSLQVTEIPELPSSKPNPSKTSSVTINLVYKASSHEERIKMNGQEYDLDSFKKHIKDTWGKNEINDTFISLRCDQRVTMGFHDEVLAICKRDGHIHNNIQQLVKIKK